MVIGVSSLDFGGSAASGAPESSSSGAATPPSPPGEFDPARASGIALHLIRTACDGLTTLDDANGKVRPALAQNLQLEAGTLKMTVSLKPKLTFPDGTALDALAVRESLSRVARPATTSRWASLLDRVSGYAEVQSGQADHLTGIKVIDPLTLEISFTAPAGDFPTTLAHPSLTPVSTGGGPEAADPPKLNGPNVINCSGPYRVEAGASQGSLNLRRASGRSRNTGPDAIRVESFESLGDAYTALTEGKVDIAERPEDQTTIPTGISVERRAGSEVTYLAFDTSKPPGSDPNVVRAVSLAIGRLVIVDAVYGDRREPALHWLPGPANLACGKYIRRIADPELAKQTLGAGTDAVSGPGSLAVTYEVPVLDHFAAQAIQVQIKAALGVTVQLNALETDAFAASARDRPSGGAWVFETETDFVPADQALSDRFITGRPGNRLGYSNPGLDGAFEAWRRAVSETDSGKALTQAEDLLCGETPAVPLWRRVHHWAFNPNKVTFIGTEALNPFGLPNLRNSAGPNPRV